MYNEIHRLRHVEGFSIQRIADHLSINCRTVKKYLDMNAYDQGNEKLEKFDPLAPISKSKIIRIN